MSRKNESYIDSKTSTIISEENALKITENYWIDFANERNIDYNKFLTPTCYSGILDEDNINIMIAKELGYKPPIDVVLADAYDYYKVTFQFNELLIAYSGEKEFHLFIGNPNASYNIRSGLRWIVDTNGYVPDV